MPFQSGTIYRYSWPSMLAGKTMQYYVKVFRANVPGRYVTRPAKFDSADPEIYAQVLVQGA